MTIIRLPQLGESAAEASILAWLAKEGDQISKDQDLVEVETEKSVMTVTAPADGVLEGPLAEEGAKVAVGDAIGRILNDEQDSAEVPVKATEPVAPAQQTPPPQPTVPVDTEALAIGSATGGETPARGSGVGYFSPRVRALMDAYNLAASDINAVRGTGRAGRVSVADLERFLHEVEAQDTKPASPMRVAVADSMRRSWTRPLATVAMTCNFDALLADRRNRPGRPSATVYAIRALALALQANNAVACRLVGDRLVQPQSLDIAFAVEVKDGVRTPCIAAADGIELADLNQQYEDLLDVARDRGGQREGTPIATISNYSTFGIEWATPVPMPDESLILGIGSLRNLPRWVGGSWQRFRGCELTITFDHRVADGAAAGSLLKAVIAYLENPERL